MNTSKGKIAIAIVSAVGASLTTLVALTDPTDPAYIVEAALLAGVTSLSVALAHQIAKKDDDPDEFE